MTNPSEKRKFIRLKANYLARHIKFKLPGKDLFPTGVAESKDISAGGVLFSSDHAYQVGDIIRMELHITGWENFKSIPAMQQQNIKKLPVLVLGKVMRVEEVDSKNFDIGVAFVGIDDVQQQALLKFISHHMKT